MDKFTKGKWQYGKITQEIYAEESNGLRTNICKISREDAPEKECQANILLIASAPTLKKQRDDLLEALKKISDVEDERYTHGGFDLEVNNISKAAIAKVEKT